MPASDDPPPEDSGEDRRKLPFADREVVHSTAVRYGTQFFQIHTRNSYTIVATIPPVWERDEYEPEQQQKQRYQSCRDYFIRYDYSPR